MRAKRRTWVFIAEIIALVIFIFVFIRFGSDKINPIQVFAFSRDIIAGETIEESDLISVPISSMTVTSEMVTVDDYASIIGKKAATNVYVNTIVYRSQLTDIETSGTVSNQDLSNKVLYSLGTDYVEGLGGHLSTGDKIDLLYTSTGSVSDGENENSFIYSKIFLRDIQVYNVTTGDGYKFVDHSDITESEVSSANDESNDVPEVTSSAPTTITVIVTPEQAEQLDARRASGTIKILKRFEETQTHETLGFVIGNYGKIFSGNANAETGNLQIIDSYSDDDPNKVDSINTNQANVNTGNSEESSGNMQQSSSGKAPGVTGIPSTENDGQTQNSNENGSSSGGVTTGTTSVG